MNKCPGPVIRSPTPRLLLVQSLTHVGLVFHGKDGFTYILFNDLRSHFLVFAVASWKRFQSSYLNYNCIHCFYSRKVKSSSVARILPYHHGSFISTSLCLYQFHVVC